MSSSIIRRIAAATQSAVSRVTRWQTANPWIAFALGLAATAAFTFAASKLEVRTNIEDLFPDDTPHVVLAEKVRATLPASSQILLVLSSPDKAANERFADALCDKVSHDPEISRVECRRDISFFKKNALLFLPQDELLTLEKKLKRAIRKAVAKDMGPFGEEDDAGGDGRSPEKGGKDDDSGDDEGFDDGFGDAPEAGDEAAAGRGEAAAGRGEAEDDELVVPDENEVRKKYNIASLSEFLSNADGTLIGLKVFPSFSPSEVNRSADLIRRVNGIVDGLSPTSFHPELEWTMEGDYHKKIEEIAVIKRDLSKSSLFAVAVILVLVVAYFGRLRATLFVMVPLMSGMAWTMGLAWLTVGYLNLITAFIFAIMFGLGVDFAIHSTNRYMEERERGCSVADALERGLVHLGRPMVSAALTTTITFLSLVIFKFRGFSQFGLIAGLGVPVCLLVVYLTLPPLVVLADRIVREKPMRKT
ncbi:MAG: hypothetical protein FJ109_05925, partial [Deltaproteobacteria bacterium]|nr:hypothetical protein [Deltaproteobacteria bacterium]